MNNLFRKIVSKGNILSSLKEMKECPDYNISGKDGISFKEYSKNTEEYIIKDIQKLLKHEKAKKPLEKVISNPIGQIQVLKIESFRERVAHRAIRRILEPVLDPLMSEDSYGDRRGIHPKKIISMISGTIYKGVGHDWRTVELKFQDCFEQVRKTDILNILRNRFNIKEKLVLGCIKRLIYGDCGLSKNSYLGRFLMNVFMHELDIRLDDIKYKKVDRNQWLKIRKGIWEEKRNGKVSMNYYRNLDKIIIFTRTNSEVNESEEVIRKFCSDYNISIDDSISKVGELVHHRPIYFSGYMMKNGKEGLLIDVEDRSTFRKKLRKSFIIFKKTKNPNQLLQTIIGSMYYMDICTNIQWYIKYLETLLHLIVDNKRLVGIKMDKYKGERYYTLISRDGKFISLKPWKIRKETNKSISYYVMKSRNDFYYIPFTDYYTIEHYSSRLISFLPGLKTKQKGKCYVTGEVLEIGNFDIHHIIPTYLGGKDEDINLVLIKRSVHQALHGLGPEEDILKNNLKYQRLKSRL